MSTYPSWMHYVFQNAAAAEPESTDKSKAPANPVKVAKIRTDAAHKRSQYQVYVETSGIMDLLTVELVKIYEMAEKPEDVCEYLYDALSQDVPLHLQIEDLADVKRGLEGEVAAMQAENDALVERLMNYEPYAQERAELAGEDYPYFYPMESRGEFDFGMGRQQRCFGQMEATGECRGEDEGYDFSDPLATAVSEPPPVAQEQPEKSPKPKRHNSV